MNTQRLKEEACGLHRLHQVLYVYVAAIWCLFCFLFVCFRFLGVFCLFLRLLTVGAGMYLTVLLLWSFSSCWVALYRLSMMTLQCVIVLYFVLLCMVVVSYSHSHYWSEAEGINGVGEERRTINGIGRSTMRTKPWLRCIVCEKNLFSIIKISSNKKRPLNCL